MNNQKAFKIIWVLLSMPMLLILSCNEAPNRYEVINIFCQKKITSEENLISLLELKEALLVCDSIYYIDRASSQDLRLCKSNKGGMSDCRTVSLPKTSQFQSEAGKCLKPLEKVNLLLTKYDIREFKFSTSNNFFFRFGKEIGYVSAAYFSKPESMGIFFGSDETYNYLKGSYIESSRRNWLVQIDSNWVVYVWEDKLF